jgi:biopolymer transport protein ExbD
MEKLIIAVIAILAIVVVLFFLMMKTTPLAPPAVTTTTTSAVTTTTTTAVSVEGDESILYDQINSLTDEQLAAISTEVTGYSTSTQDGMANDISLFMYQ